MKARDPITVASRGKTYHVIVWIVDGDGSFTVSNIDHKGDLSRTSSYAVYEDDGISVRVFHEADEGVTWLRGWVADDTPATRALLSAEAMAAS